MGREKRTIRCVRPKGRQRFHDRHGHLARLAAERPIRRVISSPARLLGRLGGEMARRMVEAALQYLTERAVAETRAAFTEAAFDRRRTDRTGDRPKA